MTIKIPVQADTGSTAQEMGKVQKSADGIAESVAQIGQAGRTAAKGLGEIEQSARRAEISVQRLSRIQKILSKEYGRPVGEQEARSVAENFDAMRSNRSLMGGSRIRKYGSFEDWHAGNRQDFIDPKEAARYKRQVMGMAAAGTDLGEPSGGGGARGGVFANVAGRGLSSAKAFAGGMLAIAGISSIMGMASSAADMATEEATGADTLKRTLGDLTVDFTRLREEVRGAGEGMGVTSLESMRLAQHFAKVSNADSRSDVPGEVNNAIGFARAFGIDPNSSATFFGQMRLQGTTKADDPNSRRMAALIADAINRGQSTAKTEELLEAVTNFTSQATKLTLTAPNIEGYLGMMAGMTRTGLAGLDPTLSASIIGAADSSMRRGGAMGEASMNFSYNALTRHDPSLGPIQAKMLMSSGLFGSAKNTFGGDSVSAWYAEQTGDRSMLPSDVTSDTTNLVKMRDQMRRQGFSTPMRLDALQNYFGLQSIQQAMLLDQIKPEALTGTMDLLKTSGMNINDVSPDAMLSLSKISDADAGTLRGPMLSEIMAREDISGASKSRLGGLAASGDTEALRREMAKVVAVAGQEKTEGTQIRDSIVDLKDTLTRIGDGLLPIFIGIRSGVEALVGKIAPGSEAATRFQREREIVGLRQSVQNHESELAYETEEFEKKRPQTRDQFAQRLFDNRKTMMIERLRKRQQEERERLRGMEAQIVLDKQADSASGLGLPLSTVDPVSSQRQKGSSEQRHIFQHEITLQDANRKPLDNLTVINSTVPAPRAQGGQ